jgi:hypothetical protein
VHGSVVGWGTMLQAGKSRVRFLMKSLFFNWPNPSSRVMALGSTHPLTEMSTRYHSGGKSRPAPMADKLTADCTRCGRRHTSLRAFRACYRNSFTFSFMPASVQEVHKISFIHTVTCLLCNIAVTGGDTSFYWTFHLAELQLFTVQIYNTATSDLSSGS